jgi:large subunit ribosomal protein L9
MKVLLKEDVDNLGYAGEVHKVAPGFARNFLIPQGMAIKADPGAMKQAEVWRKRAETRRAEIKAEFEALSAKIQEVKLTFKARAGETGKLFGSITTAQMADDLNDALGTDIDRRKVGIEPLRQLGEHAVVVRLSSEFQPEFTVIIENEDVTAAAAAAVKEVKRVAEVEETAEIATEAAEEAVEEAQETE